MYGTVLVVEPNLALRDHIVEVLRSAGFKVTAAGEFHEAERILSTSNPDGIVSAVRLGRYNGLHLVLHHRSTSPRTFALLTGVEADAALESEAKRHGVTAYLVLPVSDEELLRATREGIAAVRRQRKWPRRPVPAGLPASVQGTATTVVDVSYGGVRLEADATAGRFFPAKFEMTLPGYNMTVPVQMVWSQRLAAGGSYAYGLEILESDPSVHQAWQTVVDAIPKPTLGHEEHSSRA
jgi:CheY-like chemotaxis protein